MKVRTHKVARAAYERVAAPARKDAEYRKKYAALAHKLPGMILQNGLAQATGFLVAKAGDEHFALLDDLCFVMSQAGVVGPNDRLHETVIGADVRQTMRLTRSALDASGWIKRYVQGVLRVDSTGEEMAEDGP